MSWVLGGAVPVHRVGRGGMGGGAGRVRQAITMVVEHGAGDRGSRGAEAVGEEGYAEHLEP